MKTTLLLALAALPLGMTSLAFAQDNGIVAPIDELTAPPAASPGTGPGWQVAFNAGAQSDYVFRGISQTNERPSGFAGVDITYDSRWYVGAWSSNVDFTPSGDTSTRQEYDVYGGWRPTLAGINLDIGYIYYGYRDQPRGTREAYAETYLRGTHAFGALTLGGAAYYSPNFPGSAKHAMYGEANLSYAINAVWSTSAALGRQYIAHAVTRPDGSTTRFAYNTWNAGLSWSINDHTALDLRYWDTDTHGSGDIYHARVVASLKATF